MQDCSALLREYICCWRLSFLIPRLVAEGKTVLTICCCSIQGAFKTYDSLWRYAESREYLMLIVSAFCGFTLYEVVARVNGVGTISFVLLAAIASLWILGMLVLCFSYRCYRAMVLRNKQKGAILVPIQLDNWRSVNC